VVASPTAIPRAAAIIFLVLAACAPAARYPGLNATLWVQTAAEYRASAEQAYAAAVRALPDALADSTWTAAVEQTGNYRDKPAAIVVDVDETVLLNTPHQAFLVREDLEFNPETWDQWVQKAAAEPVPGAVEFLADAASRGVTVFYITNRGAEQEEATRANLESQGFPLDPERDTVFLYRERPEWDRDKSSRRAAVAEAFRVVLVVGDDFNDFVSARIPLDQRDSLVRAHAEKWGRKWIVLPNPTYGSWEDALWSFESDLSEEEALHRKLEILETFEP
jgi:5'-nucleotidase (lipoprotein e(P4) family)